MTLYKIIKHSAECIQRPAFRTVLLACFIMLVTNNQLTGQGNRFVFSHLNVTDGLSQNQINCIYRDSKGFMWFGTNAGLNRFDGLNFEIFSTENSSSSPLANNNINSIIEDNSGNIWIGTDHGISILDGKSYQITNFEYTAAATHNCGDIYYINSMLAAKNGNIWIGTNNGCFYKNMRNDSIHYLLIDAAKCSAPLNGITALTEDHSGNIWMSSKNGFIIKYDPVFKSIQKFKIPDKSNELANSVTRLFIDNDNELWVGNLYGLYLFHPGKDMWDNQFSETISKTADLKRIGAISQNMDGLIWIAADGGGAYIIDKDQWIIRNIKSQPTDNRQLSSNGLSFVHCDKEGIVWFGSTKKGIDYYKKNINKFRIYKSFAGDNNSLSNSDINAIIEDPKGNIWIGTDGGGLNYLDRKTHKITQPGVKNSPYNTLSSNIIVSLYADHAQKIWIGTYFGGLNKYDPLTGKFTVYKYISGDTTSVSDDRIYGIGEDSLNNLWVGTLGRGLNRLNPATGKFERINRGNSSLCFDFITSIYRDKQNVLWISTTNGLSVFDNAAQAFRCYTFIPGNPNSISDNNVINCFEDSRGLFWICTKNGLNLLDRNTHKFRQFKTSDGLPSNSIHAIVEDKNGNLWISSKNGISKLVLINVTSFHDLNFTVTNYNITDGLQGKEFNQSASLCTTDGEIFFGGPDGLNAFYPDEIKEDTTDTKMIFSDFRIFNKSVPYGQKHNNRYILDNPIFNTDKIALKYHENSFTIGFHSLTYFFPENNNYAYKLEGFDNDWVTCNGKNNSATYTNLSNGTYTFRVKEIKNKSFGNEIALKIVVLPPFWKSWIAYFIYAILILLVFILLRHLILVRERMNTRVEHERLEALHLHEIDSLKIKLFTNISHEFRTPLTLIMSPVEKLLSQFKEQPEEKYLKLIDQNAKRLLQMVNQLLDFRKLEVQGFSYNPSYGDIVAFLSDTVSSFSNLGEKKHIELVFKTKIKTLNTSFDKDKLEKIMFNLLSNAFKFTPGYGKVTVSLDLEPSVKNKESNADNNLVIRTEDTGIGIPADKTEKIFTRFFQVDSSGQVEKGTGIGLSLVAEFVKLHNGEIFVSSEVNKGSCFTVVLPVSNEGCITEPVTETDGMISYFKVDIPEQLHLPPTSQRPVVLIAEDNDDLRFYLKDNLLQSYEIHEASNGEEGLRITQKLAPDLIISDIMMPVMDGIEFCRRVKSDRTICHIPFILLTAKSTEPQQLEGINTGADDYVTKPFNFQILEAKIANFINLRKNARQLFKNKLRIEPHEITITSLDEQFMKKALELVEKNMGVTDYSVETMSRDLGMSRTLLYKKILALTGKPPLEFVRSLRLKRAAILLSKSQLNVSEIAFQVGFNDPKYFSKHFKNEFGVLPSKYVGK